MPLGMNIEIIFIISFGKSSFGALVAWVVIKVAFTLIIRTACCFAVGHVHTLKERRTQNTLAHRGEALPSCGGKQGE